MPCDIFGYLPARLPGVSAREFSFFDNHQVVLAGHFPLAGAAALDGLLQCKMDCGRASAET
jgi:hypothetical protein